LGRADSVSCSPWLPKNAIWGNAERVWAVGEHGTILLEMLD
jgi:hypothetical protein